MRYKNSKIAENGKKIEFSLDRHNSIKQGNKKHFFHTGFLGSLILSNVALKIGQE